MAGPPVTDVEGAPPPRPAWAGMRCLLVAHAGDRAGHAALAPALRVLAAWAGRGGGRLVGLWPGPAPCCVRGATDRDLRYDLARGIDLLGEAPEGAVVLADRGRTALDLAYALHLAGVPRRAGAASEFGGGVLTDPVPLGDLAPAEAHPALLHALGLGAAPRYTVVQKDNPGRGGET